MERARELTGWFGMAENMADIVRKHWCRWLRYLSRLHKTGKLCMWPLVSILINAYEDVYPFFIAKKAGQLFVFYCVVRFCIVPYGC